MSGVGPAAVGGTAATAGTVSGVLPFTGVGILVYVALAVALIAGGLIIRRVAGPGGARVHHSG
jgi:hypothetical protein